MVLRATQVNTEEGEERIQRKMNDQRPHKLSKNSILYNRMQFCSNNIVGQNNMYSIPHYMVFWFLSKIL